MTQSTTITSKGQVTIPISIRRKMGLKTGETVKFSINNMGKVVIEKNDWKAGISGLGKEVSAHLKKQNIKPLTDEQLDELINSSASRAISQKYS